MRPDISVAHAAVSGLSSKNLVRQDRNLQLRAACCFLAIRKHHLGLFGISLVVIQIAGGLLVAATGWNLLNQKDDASTENRASETMEDALQHAFFPLTLPITVGPGSISIAITLGAHLRHQAGPGWEHGYPRHFIAGLIAMFLLSGLVLVCYSNANRMERLLGRSGTNIVTRLSAFILFAIGVQILWNGLSAGMPQAFAPLPH